MKDSLTKKLGPLPAWAWLLFFGVAVYLYRKYSAAQSASATTTSDVPTDSTTAATPQTPVVLEPGESVYDPNTGQLVGGSGTVGGSGAGTGGSNGGASFPSTVGDITGSDTGTSGTVPTPGTAAPAGNRRGGKAKTKTKKVKLPKPRHPGRTNRAPKPIKLNIRGIATAGSALSGAKALSKPRSAAHTKPPRTQKAARPRLPVVARPPVHPTVNKKVKPKAQPIRTRVGRTSPIVSRTETQRPTATHPVGRPAPAPAPPPRAATHTPGRTAHAGGPPRVARPRRKR